MLALQWLASCSSAMENDRARAAAVISPLTIRSAMA
jgi:hypothetical protein